MKLKNIIYKHLLTNSQSLRNYFPTLSMTDIQWVVQFYGPSGEENIENANLTSTKKERPLEISSNTT